MVEQLNRQFDGGVLDLYITFLLAVLDVEQHRLSVVNAGHPCPLIIRRDGKLEEFGRTASGLPLAIMPDYGYETAETTLEPGETVDPLYRRRHRRDECRGRSPGRRRLSRERC